MSIPPKYGRVYTRINGGVSCKAITFPFLRFRCAGKGASLRSLREGKKEEDREKEDESRARGTKTGTRGKESEEEEDSADDRVGRVAGCVTLHVLTNRTDRTRFQARIILRTRACYHRMITTAFAKIDY